MTAGAPGMPQNDRLLELLADRAVQGLSAPEAAELERLLREIPGAMAEAERFELAAAAADLALTGDQIASPMPAALRAKVASQAEDWMAVSTRQRSAPGRDVLASIAPAPRMAWSGATGWIAAAACLILAVAGWFGRAPSATKPVPSLSALVSSATDLKQWDWTPLGELEKSAVSGKTYWSTAKQQGFMEFAGLPANDPSKEQYQLWIFDPAQSDKTPIDGGVFDVNPSTGKVIVAMDPKIRVSDAAMFAVTIEKPGGVVVSDRKRLVLLAKPS